VRIAMAADDPGGAGRRTPDALGTGLGR